MLILLLGNHLAPKKRRAKKHILLLKRWVRRSSAAQRWPSTRGVTAPNPGTRKELTDCRICIFTARPTPSPRSAQTGLPLVPRAESFPPEPTPEAASAPPPPPTSPRRAGSPAAADDSEDSAGTGGGPGEGS